MYSRKTIQNLKPEWYLRLSKTEKLNEQKRLKEEADSLWNDKPKKLPYGTKLIAKESTKSITGGQEYKVMGYFATLITTIYYSKWNEFVTLKNDYGWTVKMNLDNFDLKK